MDTMVRENHKETRPGQREQFVVPGATLRETSEGYTLAVEMPGVNKEGLEILVDSNELTIIGRRSLPAIDGAVLHRESRPENFRRAFEIDPSIETGKISARMDQGILTLALPKAEHVKPRTIAVE